MVQRQHITALIRRFPFLIRIPYYVYRFFQPKYTVGVVGVVLNEQQQVLLVEHAFHPRRPWGLPGGWIGFNEDPETGIARELREELALSVTIRGNLLARRTQFNHLDIAFLCEATSEIGDLNYELLGYEWYRIDELPHIYPFHYDAIHKAVELQS